MPHMQLEQNAEIEICNMIFFTAYLKRHQSMRAHTRVPSRATSPALSTKSRKSVLSNRNVHRNSYIEHDLTDEDSSDSDGYLEDFRSLRGDRRESNRSLRSSRRSLKSSPPHSIDYDDDSENFSRNESSARNSRSRRSGSAARSISSRTEKKLKKTTSDVANRQDSESELGTRAKVQAKIREKIAQQQSSLDESSSDFWKPKSNQTPSKTNKNADSSDTQTSKSNGKVKKVSTEVQTSTTAVKTAQKTPAENVPRMVATTTSSVPDKVDALLGPPPKTPNFEWECEYCTFANEANTKICSICCKTPSNAPSKLLKAANAPTTNGTKLNKNVDGVAAAAAAIPETTDTPKGRKLSKKISFWPGTKTK